MKWQCSSMILSTFFITIFLCSFIQTDGKKIRRRRQYQSNNYGAYAIDPPVVSYYGSSGGGSYTGNNQNQNRFIVGGAVYQFPTPVNVMSAGQYNPQQYNAYPPGSDGYYYSNFNNMRLPSSDGWYPGYYYSGYPFFPFFNSAQLSANMSIMIKLFYMIFICLFFISFL